MRIGIMLRSLDEKYGIGIYTRNILNYLLKNYPEHTFCLFYRNPDHLGLYKHLPQVEEFLISAPHKILWDQWAIPRAARTANVDILFHTKFTVPFRAHCPTVMVLHGANWFYHPEFYGKFDMMYVRTMMPRYCHHADALVSISERTTNDFVNLLKVDRNKIHTIHHGVNPMFQPIKDTDKLQLIREKYALPENFLLTVGRFSPRKNFNGIFQAYQKSRSNEKIHLVVVGDDREKYESVVDIAGSGIANQIHFPGYVPQEDLPAFYSLAKAFLFPTIFEDFGIPLLEAMACGCPIVAANTAAIPEVTNGAAILAAPHDIEALATGIDRLIEVESFRQKLINLGLERAAQFDWNIAAEKTLQVLEKTVGNKPSLIH